MARLDNLPNELLHAICSYLDHEDLKSLSLTSKNLSPASRSILSENICITLWMNEWNEFVDFMDYDRFLHQYVRQIRFYAQSSTQARTCLHPTSRCNHILTQGLPICETYAREVNARKKVAVVAFQPDSFRKMMKRFPKLDSLMLTSEGRGNDHINCNRQDERTDRSYIYLSQNVPILVSHHSPGREGCWDEKRIENLERDIDETVLSLFLVGLGRTDGLILKELDIGAIYEAKPYSDQDFSTTLSASQPILRTVEKLSLFFRESRLNAQSSFPPSAAQSIAELASSNLRELRLGWHQERWPGRLAQLDKLLAASFPYLRLLALCGFELDAKQLKKFLWHHRAAFTRLDLHNITFVFSEGQASEGSYPRLKKPRNHLSGFFEWIAQHMNLREARFSGDFRTAYQSQGGQHQHPLLARFNLGHHEYYTDNGRSKMYRGATNSLYHQGRALSLAVAAAQPISDMDAQIRQCGGFTRSARVRWIECFFHYRVSGDFLLWHERHCENDCVLWTETEVELDRWIASRIGCDFYNREQNDDEEEHDEDEDEAEE